ncbi:putative asparagine--tRNA ligase [Helianthus debilis subsp. tardiflorus]
MSSAHQPFDEMPNPNPTPTQVEFSKYSKRVILKTILDREDGGLGLVDQRVVVGGWVKSSRELRKDPPPMTGDRKENAEVKCVEVFRSKIPFLRTVIQVFGGNTTHIKEKVGSKPALSIAFLKISDGSSVTSLQIVVDSSIAPASQLMPTGTCILAEGVLQKSSIQGKHEIELKAEKMLHIGIVDQESYPLSKKKLALSGLRDHAHFRPRTTTVASVLKVRNGLNQASHTFFQNHGFVHVDAPIITATNAKGSSENFQVSTSIFSAKEPEPEPASTDDTENASLETIKLLINEKSKKIEELKRSDSSKEALDAALQDLHKINLLANELEARSNTEDLFFSNQAFLTTSGSLHLESFASAFGYVYAFGPRFQANKSESKKNSAKNWMIETEIAFSELEDAMKCAEDFVRFVSNWVSKNCHEDLHFLSKRGDKAIIDRLNSVALAPFEKITYATAVEVLNKVTDTTFETKIELGVALSDEHESYLVEFYKKPVIIFDFPKELKPFNVRLNDDGKTVAAFDVIVPKVGTLVRGSQKEERLNYLSKRIEESGLRKDEYEWYLDLCKQGAVKHSGFDVMFDVMVLFATGLSDVRDVIPFPRHHGKLHN